MEMIRITAYGPKGLFDKYGELLGNDRKTDRTVNKELVRKYGDMLGNRRDCSRRRENVLLTVRQDAVEIRQAILDGRRKGALRRVDDLIDNLDNRLAEGEAR